MLRIYCDSNIYRYLNPRHPSFTLELLDVFESLKDKMLFTFSDAHLDDLRNSTQKYAEADLLLMGRYVKDNYFMHDLVKNKRTGPYLATPVEAYDNKDYVTYERVLNNPFDVDNLFAGLDEFEGGKAIKDLMKSFFDLPIAAFGTSIEAEKMDIKNKEWFNKLMPNYDPMMSLGNFMNDMFPYSRSLLQNEKELTELRKYIASYMDRDEYSFEKWGIGFNERFKQSALGKSYTEMIEAMLTANQKNDLYQRFSYAYNLLEIYNITQERNSKGLKKFNLHSLNTDALHAWFASFSDYFVTDDKGLQVKASIVYQLLGLPTKVLSSKDFVNHKSILLGQEENYDKFTTAFKYDLKNSLQLYERVDPFKEERVNTFKTTHAYFNYFNRFQIIKSKGNTVCAFYCDRESHGNFFMYREIELIVNKMIDMLGIDSDNRGKYDLEEKEKYQIDEIIRRWNLSDLEFSLLTSSKSWGNFLCLSINFFDID